MKVSPLNIQTVIVFCLSFVAGTFLARDLIGGAILAVFGMLWLIIFRIIVELSIVLANWVNAE